MSKHICLYAILLLFVASLSLQYFRIRMRKQLIDITEQFVLGKAFEDDWKKAGEGFGAVFKDFKRMRVVKKSTSYLPDHILERLQKFKILCTVEQATTISTLLTAAFAYKFCV